MGITGSTTCSLPLRASVPLLCRSARADRSALRRAGRPARRKTNEGQASRKARAVVALSASAAHGPGAVLSVPEGSLECYQISLVK